MTPAERITIEDLTLAIQAKDARIAELEAALGNLWDTVKLDAIPPRVANQTRKALLGGKRA